MKEMEEWRQTVAYYNEIRVCKVPKTHEEVITEEEWNDYVPKEAKKVGHKVLCGFIVIPDPAKKKKVVKERVERSQVKAVRLSRGMKIAGM